MIQIKRLKYIEDYEKLGEIQIDAWGFRHLDVEPHFLMSQTQLYGGLVQGLFLDEDLIGFTFAIPGTANGELILYSHMTAVLKSHQSKGYGFLLKQAQREEALRMGYSVIVWNFDPLESLNAFFNIHRLGAISSVYLRNVYGLGQTGLHQGLPTDRLVAEWRLDSKRVRSRSENKENIRLTQVETMSIADFEDPATYIEIPGNIRQLKESNMSAAKHWQDRIRRQLETAFQHNFVITDLVCSSDRQRVFYKLARHSLPIDK